MSVFQDLKSHLGVMRLVGGRRTGLTETESVGFLRAEISMTGVGGQESADGRGGRPVTD